MDMKDMKLKNKGYEHSALVEGIYINLPQLFSQSAVWFIFPWLRGGLNGPIYSFNQQTNRIRWFA